MQQQFVVPKLFRPFEDEVGVVFGLDEGFKITYCNPAWDRFAVENGGSEELLRESQLGRPLFDSIPQVLHECYEEAFQSRGALKPLWLFQSLISSTLSASAHGEITTS